MKKKLHTLLLVGTMIFMAQTAFSQSGPMAKISGGLSIGGSNVYNAGLNVGNGYAGLITEPGVIKTETALSIGSATYPVGKKLYVLGNAEITGGFKAGGNNYPTTTGTSGQVLTSDGSGNAYWNSVGGGGPVVQTPSCYYAADTAETGTSSTNPTMIIKDSLVIPAGTYFITMSGEVTSPDNTPHLLHYEFCDKNKSISEGWPDYVSNQFTPIAKTVVLTYASPTTLYIKFRKNSTGSGAAWQVYMRRATITAIPITISN